MSRLLCCLLVTLGSAEWLVSDRHTASAEPTRYRLKIEDLPITRNSLRAFIVGANLPVKTREGATVGTGNVIGFLSDSTLPMLSNFFDLTVQGDRVIVSDVLSQDLKFRGGLAYRNLASGPAAFSYAAIAFKVKSADKATAFIDIETPVLVATAQTFNFGLTFLQSPNVRTLPGLNYSSRESRLDLITGVGQTSAVGSNLNVSAAAPQQQVIGNLLWTSDQRSGAWMVTPGPGQPTVFGGLGIYSGVFGVARALNAGAFGLGAVLNAATEVQVTSTTSGVPLGGGGCLPGQPPPAPGRPTGITDTDLFDPYIRGQWDSVPCAVSYVVRVTGVSYEGQPVTREFTVTTTSFDRSESSFGNINLDEDAYFSVAAVNIAGAQSPFTAPERFDQ